MHSVFKFSYHIQIQNQREHPGTLPARKGRSEHIESNALCGKQKLLADSEANVAVPMNLSLAFEPFWFEPDLLDITRLC
jgi:hypothetical protein